MASVERGNRIDNKKQFFQEFIAIFQEKNVPRTKPLFEKIKNTTKFMDILKALQEVSTGRLQARSPPIKLQFPIKSKLLWKATSQKVLNSGSTSPKLIESKIIFEK